MNSANLTRLAEYLDTLPKTHFDMADWFRADEIDSTAPYNIAPHVNECGTVACACGHATTIFPPLHEEDWIEYLKRVFDLDYDPYFDSDFNFMFGSDWDSVDNTPQGAAKRIRYFIKNGAPIGWYYDKQTVKLYAKY